MGEQWGNDLKKMVVHDEYQDGSASKEATKSDKLCLISRTPQWEEKSDKLFSDRRACEHMHAHVRTRTHTHK